MPITAKDRAGSALLRSVAVPLATLTYYQHIAEHQPCEDFGGGVLQIRLRDWSLQRVGGLDCFGLAPANLVLPTQFGGTAFQFDESLPIARGFC